MKDGSEILTEVLKYTRNTINSLGKEIDLKRSQNLYDIRNEKVKKLSFELASKIRLKYPEFNLDWLISGEGEMLNTKKKVSDTIKPDPDSNLHEDDGPYSQTVPRLLTMLEKAQDAFLKEQEAFRKEQENLSKAQETILSQQQLIFKFTENKYPAGKVSSPFNKPNPMPATRTREEIMKKIFMSFPQGSPEAKELAEDLGWDIKESVDAPQKKEKQK